MNKLIISKELGNIQYWDGDKVKVIELLSLINFYNRYKEEDLYFEITEEYDIDSSDKRLVLKVDLEETDEEYNNRLMVESKKEIEDSVKLYKLYLDLKQRFEPNRLNF